MWIRTQRLTLRDLNEGDLNAVLSYHERSRNKQPWLGPTGQNAEWLGRVAGDISPEDARQEMRLAILLASDDRVIGACRIRYIDAVCLEAEVSFDLDPDYPVHECRLEAVAEVMRLGFQDLRLRRISSSCISSDVAMARVLEGAGMRMEDVLPRSRWIHREWWDTVVYSLQRTEWAAQRRREVPRHVRDRREL